MSNARIVRIDIPLFVLCDDLQKCAECRRQHVRACGASVCAHQVLRHWDGREKFICRPCWNQQAVRVKHAHSESPWKAAEYVEVRHDY